METIVNIATESIQNQTLTLRNLRRKAVANGARWEDIKTLSHEELEAFLLKNDFAWVKDPDAFLTKKLSSVIENNQLYKLVEIKNGIKAAKAFVAGNDTEEYEGALAEVLQAAVESKKAKLQDKEAKLLNSTMNRAEYLPQLTLNYKATASGEKNHWSFDSNLCPTGLLPRVIEDMGHKVEGQPLAIRIVNLLPKLVSENGQVSNLSESIPVEEWECLRKQGWIPVQGNLAWNFNNPVLKETLLMMFPAAIDFGAYNKRLNAPLIPAGYMTNLTIQFGNVMALSPRYSEANVVERMKLSTFKHYESQGFRLATMYKLGQKLQKASSLADFQAIKLEDPTFPCTRLWQECRDAEMEWESVDQECDGSGIYNPKHPAMAALVAKHGAVAFQITVVRPDCGLFAKGIILPREDFVSEHPIVLDMVQVKGAMKGKVKEGEVMEKCFMGVMNAWNRRSYYPGTFELLQYIHPTSKNRDEIVEALNSLLDEALDDYKKNGIDGLLAEISRDDEQMKLIVQLLTQIRANGKVISPMSIPLVRRALEDKLSSRLWVMAQGAAIRGNQCVVVMDASVPEGECVVDGFSPNGEEVAVWRFPCVLPQGLVTLRTRFAAPHQMYDGKVIPNTIFLNPKDIVSRMQGDDDGDIVGVSKDPRVLTLFKARATKKVYLVEPKGSKFDLKTAQDDGRGYEYVQRDPRGPVGQTTLYQAELLAVGDWFGAIALAVTNQEAIDAAKKRIEWSDFRALANASNWEQNEHGEWRPLATTKLSPDLYESDPNLPEGWPGQLLSKWVMERLAARGCMKARKQKALAWRLQSSEDERGHEIRLNKRIHASFWRPCRAKSGNWEGGNLVHWCHDLALEKWNALFGKEFLPIVEEMKLQMNTIIMEIAASKGIHLSVVHPTWEEYSEVLRKKAGISAYAAEFRKMLLSEKDEGAKFAKIEMLGNMLHAEMAKLTPNELNTIWYWEMTTVYSKAQYRAKPTYHLEYVENSVQVNRINYAVRACTFPGSPILSLLGMEDVQGCSFMIDEGRAQKAIEFILKSSTPFSTMVNSIYHAAGHGRVKKDEDDQPIQLWQCKCCVDHLVASFLKTWRSQKVVGERANIGELVTALNGMLDRARKDVRPSMKLEEDVDLDSFGNDGWETVDY